MYEPTIINTEQLQLADVVSRHPAGSPWGSCVVKKVNTKKGHATLFRPYGTTTDFSYTGGVICLIGVEEYDVDYVQDVQWVLHERKTLR